MIRIEKGRKGEKGEMMIPIEWRTADGHVWSFCPEKRVESVKKIEEEDMERGAKTAAKILKWREKTSERGAFVFLPKVPSKSRSRYHAPPRED